MQSITRRKYCLSYGRCPGKDYLMCTWGTWGTSPFQHYFEWTNIPHSANDKHKNVWKGWIGWANWFTLRRKLVHRLFIACMSSSISRSRGERQLHVLWSKSSVFHWKGANFKQSNKIRVRGADFEDGSREKFRGVSNCMSHVGCLDIYSTVDGRPRTVSDTTSVFGEPFLTQYHSTLELLLSKSKFRSNSSGLGVVLSNIVPSPHAWCYHSNEHHPHMRFTHVKSHSTTHLSADTCDMIYARSAFLI